MVITIETGAVCLSGSTSLIEVIYVFYFRHKPDEQSASLSLEPLVPAGTTILNVIKTKREKSVETVSSPANSR